MGEDGERHVFTSVGFGKCLLSLEVLGENCFLPKV